MGRLDDYERALMNEAGNQLGDSSVARSATEALELALEGAHLEAVHGTPSPSYYLRRAILLLSALALRTARATLLVVAAGYEPEAHGLKRRLSEVHERAQAVAADESGQHAQDWLEGKGPSTPRKLAGKFGSLELFDMYSAGGHADPHPVYWWLMVPTDGGGGGNHGLNMHPHRQPTQMNALLTQVATECRDMAHVLAITQGGRVDGLADLDGRIKEAIGRYLESPSPADEEVVGSG